MIDVNVIEKARQGRKFLPVDFEVTTWEALKPYYDQLLEQPINNKTDLEQWLLAKSELDTAVSEDYRWRYIHATCDTTDKDIEAKLNYYYEELDPNLNTYSNLLNKKLVESPYLPELDPAEYFIYLRGIKTQIELFRKENLPLFKEMNLLANKYGAITGAMQIEYKGETYTMQQAGKLMKHKDRTVREEIFRLTSERRQQDVELLNDVFTQLLDLRHQIALNASFENYRDYKFAAMGRFDYSVKDCEDFHEAIKILVVPQANALKEELKEKLGVDTLRPWDTEMDADDGEPLNPYTTSAELIEKSVTALGKVDPEFGKVLNDMDQAGFLDLDSRHGKAPGGYNMTMPESGLPFIFMNAAGTETDVRTMVHEAGHAVHSVLSNSLALLGFKRYPSEVAELASMSMELMTMGNWDVFYTSEADLKRAKLAQLKGIIKILPWVATIDKFQHWLYTHHGHSLEERRDNWLRIYNEFHTGPVNWSGLEEQKATRWQRQLHLYEVPFYYIEYGMAQLGAVALWKSYMENPQQAVANYKAALKLGYTRSIPQIYEAAGIQFRFDKAYVKELVDLLVAQIKALQ